MLQTWLTFNFLNEIQEEIDVQNRMVEENLQQGN